MSKFEDVPYEEPAPDEETIMRFHGNKVSVKSRKYRNGNHLNYKRVKGGQMLNTITGEIKPYRHRDFKLERTVWRIFKEEVDQLIDCNFKGLQSEMVFEFSFKEPVINRNDIKKIAKNIRERLQRKINGTAYIRIILYKSPYEPVVAIWLKTLDGSPIVIDQATADTVCNENEEVKIIKLTKANILKQSNYENNKNYRKDCYPPNLEICTYTKDKTQIKPVRVVAQKSYENSKKKLIGYVPTFQKSKAIFEEIEGKKQMVQRVTFQEFERIKKKIKGYKTITQKLRRNRKWMKKKIKQ